jgi:hypothetical protein
VVCQDGGIQSLLREHMCIIGLSKTLSPPVSISLSLNLSLPYVLPLCLHLSRSSCALPCLFLFFLSLLLSLTHIHTLTHTHFLSLTVSPSHLLDEGLCTARLSLPLCLVTFEDIRLISFHLDSMFQIISYKYHYLDYFSKSTSLLFDENSISNYLV